MVNRTSESSVKQETAKASRMLSRAVVSSNMEKVEAALKEAARSKDGSTISLRLDPPNLGSVKVDVTLRDGTLHARLVAEAPAVNNLLRERAHELQSILRKAGVDADQVSVSVRSDSGSTAGFDTTFTEAGNERNSGGHSKTQTAERDIPPAMAQAKDAPQGQTMLDHWVA